MFSMPPSILLVEDYDDTRDMLRVLLESRGYEVIEAADGIEAINKAKEFRPNLILMDIGLPGMDGIAATSAIKAESECADIPVIAVTAFSDISERIQNAGFIELVTKPFEHFKLLELIAAHL